MHIHIYVWEHQTSNALAAETKGLAEYHRHLRPSPGLPPGPLEGSTGNGGGGGGGRGGRGGGEGEGAIGGRAAVYEARASRARQRRLKTGILGANTSASASMGYLGVANRDAGHATGGGGEGGGDGKRHSESQLRHVHHFQQLPQHLDPDELGM